MAADKRFWRCVCGQWNGIHRSKCLKCGKPEREKVEEE